MHHKDKAILSTFLEVFKSFQLQPMPNITLQYDPAATIFLTGLNDLFFNYVCIKNPLDQEQLIIELNAIQKQYNIPLTVWITHETEIPEFEKLMKEHFESPGPFFGMLLELEQAQTAVIPENITIEIIQNPLQAKEFSKIYCDVFNLNVPKECEQWVITQYEKYNPACINYIARINGKIAGVSSLAIDRAFKEFKTGGFYNACVLPEFRNNGIATAMACHRIEVAKQMGLDNLSIVLMADAMARGYCERLGFKNYKTMTPYFIR